MGKILKDEQIRERRVTVTFTASELYELVVLEAMRIAGATASKNTLKISQEEEGSPSYPVDRWRASVQIVQEIKG